MTLLGTAASCGGSSVSCGCRARPPEFVRARLDQVDRAPADRSGHAKDGDAILMIEDGVYGATSGTKVADAVGARSGAVSFYVLGPDLAARGISDSRIMEGVTTVDYNGFVELAAKHGLTHSLL